MVENIVIKHNHFSATYRLGYLMYPVIKIGFLLQYQLKTYIKDDQYDVFVQFSNLHKILDLTMTITLSCEEMGIRKMKFFSANDVWHNIGKIKRNSLASININIDIELNKFCVPLHECEDLTDFELHGKDGSVRVHKFVLAAASPVLNRMLSQSWKETKEEKLVLEECKEVIEHFKNYIYRQIIPNNCLKELLSIAARYEMPHLELECVNKIIFKLDAGENFYEYLEFAVVNKLYMLSFAITQSIKNGGLDTEHIKNLWPYVSQEGNKDQDVIND